MKKVLSVITLLGAMTLVACGGKGGETSGASSAKSAASKQSTSKSSRQSTLPPHVHSYSDATNGEVGFKVNKCAADGDTYLSRGFYDYEGSTNTTAAPAKITKGITMEWKFKLGKATKGKIMLAAYMSSSSHSDRTFKTASAGASTNDAFESNSANDGTPRMTISVNGTAVTLTTKSYGDLGLTNGDEGDETKLSYFSLTDEAVDLPNGDVTIKFEHNASTGYRLIYGGEIRLAVNEYVKAA